MQLLCVFSATLTFNIFLNKIKIPFLHPLQKLPRTAWLQNGAWLRVLYTGEQDKGFSETVQAVIWSMHTSTDELKNNCLWREKEDKIIMEEGMLPSFGLCEVENITQW